MINLLKKLTKKRKEAKQSASDNQLLAEIRALLANQSKFLDQKVDESQTLSQKIASLLDNHLSSRHGLAEKNMKKLDEKSAAQLVDRVIKEAIEPNHHSVFWGDRLLTLDKSAGFLSDPAFSSAYQSIRGSHQYDQYASPNTISWRLNTLVWAAKCGLKLEGDFVECGVFKGDMSWVVSQTVDFKTRGKKFYLYDTFEGFSDKYSSTEDFPTNPHYIDFANSHYKDPSLYPYVCNRFAGQKEVKVIKGVVPDVLQDESPAKIAFLHMDLNSPAAEVGALEILFPRLSPGAICVFDDYGWKMFHKLKEAEDKFMHAIGYEILELPTGQGIVVKRQA